MSNEFRHPFQEAQFDLFNWYPKYQTCVGFFLEYAQYQESVQALAAYVNMRLPFQSSQPSTSEKTGDTNFPLKYTKTTGQAARNPPRRCPGFMIVPYIRRLVATGMDSAVALELLFGDKWTEGVYPIREAERLNYMFAVKSDNWLQVKATYDMDDGQMIPFLRPPSDLREGDIAAAESNWSQWLALQDWMQDEE